MNLRLPASCTSLMLTALALLASAASSRGQCALPDGLDGGPCCSSASVNLPVFPPRPQENASFLCFDSCQPSLNTLYCASLGPPKPVQQAGALVCGQYNIRMQLRPCGMNTLAWSGSVRAAYSRTWMESSVPGALNLTVWRFIANGDFLPGNALPNTPCDRPACLSQYSRIYFTGYIDYVYDCITNSWQVAYALAHECDSIHHSTASVRPAPSTGLHPTRSFAIVGPGATFVPTSVGPMRSDGPIVQGSIRHNAFANSPVVCTYREPANGAVVAQNEFCQCTTAGANQYIDTIVVANGSCGSSVQPSLNGPFLQKRLGSWTNPGTYPGVEFVLFDFGYLDTFNGCNGVVTHEWYEGGETLGGYPAIDASGLPLGTQFEDLGSANKSPNSAATRIGAPHVCYEVLNFNLP